MEANHSESNMSPTSNKIPTVKIALDYGGSSTKVLWQEQEASPKLLTIQPQVIQVSQETLASYGNLLAGISDSKNAIWVGVGGKFYAVGYFATTCFHAQNSLQELKHEKAIIKTLAAVWTISQELKIKRSLSIALTTLLPAGEYADKRRFERELKTALAKFESPTGILSVKTTLFECYPEGAGVYSFYKGKMEPEEFQKRVCAFVMLGFRNASVLTSQRGINSLGVTSDLGMVKMVREVVAKTSGQSVESLTPAIVNAGCAIKPNALRGLAKSTTPEGKAEDITVITRAIAEAKQNYLTVLAQWLDTVLPTEELTDIVFCGGTADYLKQDLESLYGTQFLCSWNAGMALHKKLDLDGVGNRFIDVLGIFTMLQSKMSIVSK